jgi:hypothetical protein
MKPVCEPFQQMPGQDAGTREPCSFSHQFVEGVLALVANNGGVVEIDDEPASLEPLARIAPRSLQFCEPGLHKLSFDYQTALRLRIDRRYLQHVLSCDTPEKGNTSAKARVIPNTCK